jgi:hypothetical protein
VLAFYRYKFKGYKFETLIKNMGCCCSSDKNKPILDLGTNYDKITEPLATTDHNVQPIMQANNNNKNEKRYSESPYVFTDEYVDI